MFAAIQVTKNCSDGYHFFRAGNHGINAMNTFRCPEHRKLDLKHPVYFFSNWLTALAVSYCNSELSYLVRKNFLLLDAVK